MNRAELEKKLDALSIRKDAYAWSGLPNEQYVLAQENNKWEVYYSERGSKTGLKEFTDESSACNYMLSLLTNDKSTRA
jgi:hypothetical protein